MRCGRRRTAGTLTLAAWRTLSGSRWGYRIGFAAAIVCWGIAANGLFLGGGGVLTMSRALPEARYLMSVTLFSAFTAQSAASLLSVRARPVR